MPHLVLPEFGAMTRPFLIAPLVLLVLAAPAAAESPGPLRPADAKGKLGHERLSDERTLTRVAYPARIRPIRSGPGKRYRTTGRLSFFTEDRAPEIYLVLRSTRDAKGHLWLQIRVPRRPNGSKGWVSRDALGRLRIRTTVARGRPARAQGAPVRRGPRGLDGEHRRRRVVHADAERPLLDPRAAAQPRRQRGLRAARVRDRRLLAAVGVARRRRGRAPRHERARADPGPAVARLHPRPQRQDPRARPADAGRDAALDPRLARTGRGRRAPRGRRPARRSRRSRSRRAPAARRRARARGPGGPRR